MKTPHAKREHAERRTMMAKTDAQTQQLEDQPAAYMKNPTKTSAAFHLV